MKLREKLLLRRLAKNDISIPLQEFNEVFAIYNFLLSYYFENNNFNHSSSVAFMYRSRRWFDLLDNHYYEIFMKLIEMKNKGFLQFLDYVLLTDCKAYNALYSEYSYLSHLCSYLNDTCKFKDFDSYILHKIKKDDCLIQNVIENEYDVLNSSTLIPDDYKDIINLYKVLFNRFYDEDYYELNYDELNYEVGLDSFLNMTYFYFLKNNMLINDSNNILSFLNDINKNMEQYIYRINMFGLKYDNYSDMLTLVDFIYQNRNKVIVKK